MSDFDIDLSLSDGDTGWDDTVNNDFLPDETDTETPETVEPEQEKPEEKPKNKRGRPPKEKPPVEEDTGPDLSIQNKEPEVEDNRNYESDDDSNRSTLSNFVEMIADANGWGDPSELASFIEAAMEDPEVKNGRRHPIVSLFNSLSEGIARNYADSAFVNDESRMYNEFLKKGGNPEQWFEQHYSHKLKDDFSFERTLEGEALAAKQKEIYSKYLREAKGFKPEKAEKYANMSELDDELGSDYEEAKSYFLEKEASVSKKLLEQQERAEKEREAIILKQIDDAKRTIDTKPDFAGFSVTETDRRRLQEYMFSVGADGKTQYMKDLEESPDRQIELAFFMMKKLNRKSVEKMLQSKVIKDFKLNLTNSSKGNSSKTKTSNPKLDDYASVFNF